MAGPDYIVQLSGGGDGQPRRPPEGRAQGGGRPWLAVLWRCCGVYSRIYPNRAATAYEGRCPRCTRPVRIRIGPEGTAHRFFEAR